MSPADRLWIGRALFGESGTAAGDYGSILHTLARRFLWSQYKGSFVSFVRAFCQPVNDSWLPGGAKFETAKKKTGEQWKVATGQKAVDRRIAIRSMDWADLPLVVRDAVLQFEIGDLAENETTKRLKTTNFASWAGIERAHPGGIRVATKNYFFSDRAGPLVVIERKQATENQNFVAPIVGFFF